MNNFEYVKLLIKQLSGKENSIAVNISFMKYMKSLEGGAFLSQMVYWSDKSKREDGFFYKTYKDWHDELYLSEHTVRKLTKKLIEKGFLETKLKKANGSPTIHYKFDFELFCHEFIGFLKNEDSILNKSTLENENINIGTLKSEVSLTKITTKNTTKITTSKNPSSELRYGPEDDCYKLSELLYKMALKNNDKFKEPNMQKWSNDFRLMLEVDKYTPLEIQNLIVFSQTDDFWKGNILSPAKLRKQAITLTNRRNEMLKRNGRYYQKPQPNLPVKEKNDYDDLSL